MTSSGAHTKPCYASLISQVFCLFFADYEETIGQAFNLCPNMWQTLSNGTDMHQF